MSLNPETLNPESPARQRRGVKLLELGEQLYIDLAGPIQRIPRSRRYRDGADLERSLRELNDMIIDAVSSRGQPSKIYALHNHCRKVGWRLSALTALNLIKPPVTGELLSPPSGKKGDKGGTLYQIKAIVGSWRQRTIEAERHRAAERSRQSRDRR